MTGDRIPCDTCDGKGWLDGDEHISETEFFRTRLVMSVRCAICGGGGDVPRVDKLVGILNTTGVAPIAERP